MKYLFLILIAIIESVLIWYFSVIDIGINHIFLICLFLSSAIIIKVVSRRSSKVIQELSWSYLYGSVTSLGLFILFIGSIIFMFRNIADK